MNGAKYEGPMTAVLGPTNTGKTYLALQRMLGHATGMIGFPLRLLARENYDKVVQEKGVSQVALVTGEEKIIPQNPRYWICTVEAMPLDVSVSFLAIDEIQISADPERGYVFTDRLLNARGTMETMFMGSDTMAGVIRELLPDCEIETRPRFSELNYVSPKRLQKVPRRSAIVVFSASDVYHVAENLRGMRGGCAVVLGALSPRTRNAQVEMYQAGEVDYLVATDAIGMGLNMDLDHVTFAKTSKFDGRQARRLRAPEIGQIAGRAGRHMNNGTFCTTTEIGGFPEEIVEAVENHRFDPVEMLQWRSRNLDFSSPSGLLRSLEKPPPHPLLSRTRDAEDHQALKVLLKDEDVAGMARSRAALRTLWDVAQVPDFRKTLFEQHTAMLGQIYRHLVRGVGRVPEDFVEQHVSRLDNLQGDIDTLVNRIASVRTWTFISHRASWVTNAKYWQEKARKIDDKLSDALHERLTQRFVDRRATIMARVLMDGAELNAEIDAKEGTVKVEGEHVGHIKGLVFSPDPSIMDASARPVFTAARRVMVKEVENRVQQLLADNDGAFRLTEAGQLLWRENQVGHLVKGESLLFPGIEVIHNDMLQGTDREKIRQRVEKWTRAHLRNRMKIFHDLQAAPLKGTARGLAFQLVENFGLINRENITDFLKDLGKDERKALYDQGVRIGRFAVWMRGLANTQHWPWRVLLWTLWNEHADVRDMLPAQGAKVMHPERDVPLSLYQTLGFAVLWPPSRGERKERPIVGQVETLDRLAGHLHSQFRARPDFIQPTGMDQQLGCDAAMVRKLMFAFGYVPSRLSAEEAVAAAADKQAKADAQKEAATVATTDAAAVEVETSPADEMTADEAAPEAAADADQGNTATEEASPEELVVEEASPAEPIVEEQTPEEPVVEEPTPEASNEPNIDAKDEHAPAAAPPPADAAVWTRRGRGAGGRPDQRKSSGAPKSGDQSGVAGKPGNRQPPADRAGRQAKPGGGKGKGSRPPKNNAGGKPRREADKPMDPNSPFAVLAQLKK